MIWIYDEALANDLSASLVDSIPVVKVVDSDIVTEIVAASQNDTITYPIVALTRHPDTPIDTSRTNFTRSHQGVPVGFDNASNEILYETAIPIELSYDVTVLATNTIDLDELIRELMFKYTNMYFVDAEIPYEIKRNIRFGVSLASTEISRKSGVVEALHQGKLYQAIFTLKCDGCVLIHYKPRKLVSVQRPETIEVK